ncbi:EpsG family protein [Niabella aurantiaca]|uniref:EpsG family protein n=1 Tax=Niabella aurantiaca TaxID=379900 RepID=UPI00146B0BC1
MLWLYVFLCFGYTVGTDWRQYENIYNYAYDKDLLNKGYEQGFYYLIYFARGIINDFWLFLGLIKCLYLYSTIRFIKKFTTDKFLAIAVMLNYNLLFMLIDNPLRFMTGSIILLWSTGYLLNKKYIKFTLVASVSIFFHISLIIPTVLSLLFRFKNKLIYKSKTTLTGLYFAACAIGFFPEILNLFSTYFSEYMPRFSYKLLNVYVAESGAMLTLGSLILFFLFFVLLHYRNVILKSQYGDYLFFFGLLYMYLYRILMIVPTAFRLTLYFGLFFALCLTIIIKSTSRKLKYSLFILLGLTISKTLWNSYQYLPYTNSIYYILTSEHLPKKYRDNFNKYEYHKRTGKVVKEEKPNE